MTQLKKIEVVEREYETRIENIHGHWKRERAVCLSALKAVWTIREELELDEVIEEKFRDALYLTGSEFLCIAEDVGADECRCSECIERFVDQAEYLRDVEKEG